MQYTLTKKFKTKAKATLRTVKVSDAFGIGIDDEHEFTIYEDFELDINKGNIIYITGDSGSGKSLLLKDIEKSISQNKEFKGIININEINIEPNEILIEGLGKDVKEAISTLSMTGLNEAFLMLRPYKELSDGQKYRYVLAKMINQEDKDVWIADEFCSILDRTTAKVVSYTMQKIARQKCKTLIIATTHRDLKEDLKADILIDKRFGSEVEVCKHQTRDKECSLLKEIKIELANREEFEMFKQFHYKGGLFPASTNLFKATLNNETLGIIVYGLGMPNLRARNVVLPFITDSTPNMQARMKLINDLIRRIWRVVVLPKYRSIGLGAKLVKETMPLVNVPYIETMAVMAHYNPFFEKAGMTYVNPDSYLDFDDTRLDAENTLIQLGFDPELFSSREHTSSIINKVIKEGKIDVLKEGITKFAAFGLKHNDLREKIQAGDIETMINALKKRPAHYAYLIWHNKERFSEYPDPIIVT